MKKKMIRLSNKPDPKKASTLGNFVCTSCDVPVANGFIAIAVGYRSHKDSRIGVALRVYNSFFVFCILVGDHGENPYNGAPKALSKICANIFATCSIFFVNPGPKHAFDERSGSSRSAGY